MFFYSDICEIHKVFVMSEIITRLLPAELAHQLTFLQQ